MSGNAASRASVASKGLEGIKAATSEICFIDGSEGVLLYRGYNIHELAAESSFEEVVHLLLAGRLPTAGELETLRNDLARERRASEPVLQFVRSLPASGLPMAALRSAVSVAGVYDPQAEDGSADANYRKAVRLTAQLPTLIGAFHRYRRGLSPLEPRADLSHAANFLYLLTGREPTADETRALDVILTLHADHGFNASTFTARVIAATLSDVYSAVTGGIGALKGPLHGGANQRVLEMLTEIGDVSGVEPYVRRLLENKQKIMGFGHRVYKVEDPRAAHLKELSKTLADQSDEPKWYEMSVEMENIVKQEKQINCNVDFYSASVQHYLGIPADLFTCVFAASRVAGWGAHVLEQLADNRLIRPLCDYTGASERPYVPISERV